MAACHWRETADDKSTVERSAGCYFERARTVSRRFATKVTFGILAFLFAIYVASPVRTPFDSRWSIHTALSLVERQGGDLSDYLPLLEKNDFYAIEFPGGRPHTVFPIGVSGPLIGTYSQWSAVIEAHTTTWWAREDSNLQPDRYERSALTVELRARASKAPHARPNTMLARARQFHRE
jgi:hypothetical protein